MDSQTDDEQSLKYVELVNYNATELKTEQSEPETYTIQMDGNLVESNEDVVLNNTESEDDPGMEEVEYIDSEDLNDDNTIIIHEGKQYVIPTEKLRQAGNTIILENEEEMNDSTTENELINQETSENMYYTDSNAENTVLNGQFAILKDGKLIFDHNKDQNEDNDMSSNDDIDQKIRDFAETIHNLQENDEYDDENEQQSEEDEGLEQITGKNLITGQTISLSGFMEKMKRKGLNDVGLVSRRTAASSKIGSDYILVPPVNRRVVVGKTTDGKKLVGKILQIHKKIQNPQQQIKKQERSLKRARFPALDPGNSPSDSNQEVPGLPDLPYSPLLDENVARTLSGLMDLQSVSKSLVNRKLIVKHIQRRSFGGKVLAGSRKIAFYCGQMNKTDLNAWTFVSDVSEQKKSETDIDVLETTDNQTIKLKLDQGGFVSNATGVQEAPAEPDEYINLFLTVTVDEFNKKRTKVSIPQLGQNPGKKIFNTDLKNSSESSNNFCTICEKKFQTSASLRRHITLHNQDLRPLQCLQCLARFTDESSLKKHLLLHSGLKPHTCSICSKNFAHKSDLNCHMKTHNSIKQYQCSVCLKTFHRHSNMVRHQSIHQTNARSNDGCQGNSNSDNNDVAQDAEKYPPFCCEQCGSCFNFVSSLTRHIVTHHLIGEETEASASTLDCS